MDRLIVLNEDDENFFLDHRLIKPDRLTRIDGIGIDLAHYAPAPPHSEPVRFLMMARLIREKGVELFLDCAGKVRRRYPRAEFRLLGGMDVGSDASSILRIERASLDGIIEWPGHVDDVRPHLAESSVFVLPTLYREGLPRSTMEAMAMGRPVITSDMPGARNSITHGVSDFVHTAGDLDSLVEYCSVYCERPGEIAQMGRAALAEARRRYALPMQNFRQIEAIIGASGRAAHHCERRERAGERLAGSVR